MVLNPRGFVPEHSLQAPGDSELCSFVSSSWTEKVVLVFRGDPQQEWFDLLADVRSLPIGARWQIYDFLNGMSMLPTVRIAAKSWALPALMWEFFIRNLGISPLMFSISWLFFTPVNPFVWAFAGALSFLFWDLYVLWLILPVLREEEQKLKQIRERIAFLIVDSHVA